MMHQHQPLLNSPASTSKHVEGRSNSLLKVNTGALLDVATLLDSLDSTPLPLPDNKGIPVSLATPVDPIDFLNKHFSTEAQLSAHLPILREKVVERIMLLDERISTTLQRQSETATATRKHVQDAKASVKELENRIRQIKDKALQSEKAVLEITKDMKRLDCAKKHLQRTITTHKKLHMLIHAAEQLRLTCFMKPFPDYRTAANLIEATRLLLSHFEAYRQKVQPMRILSEKVVQYQENLRMGLVHGFRIVAFGVTKTKQLEEQSKRKDSPSTFSKSSNLLDDSEADEDETMMSLDVLQGGVLLIDALGEKDRNRFIYDFCQDHLWDYVKEFEPSSRERKEEKRVSSFKAVEIKSEPEKSMASLDQLEKRFAWFRDILEGFHAKFSRVFPPFWNIHASMASLFLQLTRDHILALLDGPRKDPEASNASVLMKSLQKTILFEKDITGYLQREFNTVFDSLPPNEVQDIVGDTVTTPVQKPFKPLTGIASGAFESFMEPYIRLEEQSMDEQLVEALEDRTVDTRGERPVFISSTNLFVYIKGSITRCTRLTKGKAFYMLYLAFKDSLRKYSQILNGKLPAPQTTQTSSVIPIAIAGSFGGKMDSSQNSGSSFRLPKGEEITVCHVINTCEYCVDTMEALEDLIRETIDNQYKTKIDMMSDQEAFHEITAKAVRVLVSGLTNRTENALKTMAAFNWSVCDSVGEESAYVRSIHEEIQPMVIDVRGLLPTSYFRSFCDKFAATFISAYNENLIRLKRISEPGTQQLLLDVYSIKTLFLKLPVLEEPATLGKKITGSTIAPAMYTKMIQKQFGRIETMLKLVGTPNDLVIDNFKVQWAGGSASDLQTVLVLKGLKRNEQAGYLEKFGLDPVTALSRVTAGITSAALVSERVQALQDQGSTVAAKVNSDLNQMRQKVDDFRKSFKALP